MAIEIVKIDFRKDSADLMRSYCRENNILIRDFFDHAMKCIAENVELKESLRRFEIWEKSAKKGRKEVCNF